MAMVAQRSRFAIAGAFVMGALAVVGWNLVPASPEAAGGSAVERNTSEPLPATSRGAGVGGPLFADIIERVKPAVVTIVVERDASPVLQRGYSRRGPGGEGMDEFFERFFGPNGPNVPGAPQGRGPRSGAQGSGFIIDERGYVVTNNHVVSGADTVKVVLDDGAELVGKVVGTDPATDLALLKVDAGKVNSGRKLRAVEFGDSDRARVGDWVVAIGNPFGFGGTATVGIISARGRDLRSGPYDDFLQVDAAINSGNSGGPVFDASGRVIGVNTAIYSPNGGNVGLGFAIPAAQVKLVIAELRNGGKVHRGWLGVQIQDLTPELARSLGLKEAEGALVADVVAGSPAQKSGIQPGDVVRRYGDTPIKNAKELSRRVAGTDTGHDVSVDVWRDNKLVRLKVDIGAQTPALLGQQGDAAPDSGAAQAPAAPGGLGLELGVLDADARAQLGAPAGLNGVVVRGVRPDSKAAEQGMRPGDVITMVNRRVVRTPQNVIDAVGEARRAKRDAVSLLVQRGDAKQFVAIELKD